MDNIKSKLPEYAKDIKLNLSSVLTERGSGSLTQEQRLGTALATAIASGNATLTAAIEQEAESFLDEATLNAARGSAAIMGMNNIYYRFVHLAENPDYGQMPANLRMNMLMNPGVDKLTFELYSIAVSAVNGCGLCISSHEKSIKHLGGTNAQVQDVVRIASAVHAAAQVLSYEESKSSVSAEAAA